MRIIHGEECLQMYFKRGHIWGVRDQSTWHICPLVCLRCQIACTFKHPWLCNTWKTGAGEGVDDMTGARDLCAVDSQQFCTHSPVKSTTSGVTWFNFLGGSSICDRAHKETCEHIWAHTRTSIVGQGGESLFDVGALNFLTRGYLSGFYVRPLGPLRLLY